MRESDRGHAQIIYCQGGSNSCREIQDWCDHLLCSLRFAAYSHDTFSSSWQWEDGVKGVDFPQRENTLLPTTITWTRYLRGCGHRRRPRWRRSMSMETTTIAILLRVFALTLVSIRRHCNFVSKPIEWSSLQIAWGDSLHVLHDWCAGLELFENPPLRLHGSNTSKPGGLSLRHEKLYAAA